MSRQLSSKSTTCSLASDEESADGDSPTPTEVDSLVQDPVSQGSDRASKLVNPALKRTKMCKFYAKGVCKRGASCNFAHEQVALQPQPNLYRTRLCVAFAESGHCKNGDSCRYAHGAEQLRTCLEQDDQQFLEDFLDDAATDNCKAGTQWIWMETNEAK